MRVGVPSLQVEQLNDQIHHLQQELRALLDKLNDVRVCVCVCVCRYCGACEGGRSFHHVP